MMNPLRTIAILAFCLLLTGCDFVRGTLGKPTSEDIERIRLEKVEMEKAKADSIARAEAERDSLLAVAEANRIKRFYIVIGSFKVEENAQKLVEKMYEAGIDARLLDITSSMVSVAICGNDDEAMVKAKLEELKASPDFRYEAFIYDTEEKIILK